MKLRITGCHKCGSTCPCTLQSIRCGHLLFRVKDENPIRTRFDRDKDLQSRLAPPKTISDKNVVSAIPIRPKPCHRRNAHRKNPRRRVEHQIRRVSVYATSQIEANYKKRNPVHNQFLIRSTGVCSASNSDCETDPTRAMPKEC